MTIPIVFATDDNYAHGAAVAIYSLLCNADKSADYEIYIFNTGLLQESKNVISKIVEKFDNAKIIFTDLSSQVKDLEFHFDEDMPEHITVETMYRLFIAEVLQQYEKVIYLDVDIIVLGNIKELYDIDIGDNIVGAVKVIDYLAVRLKDYIETTLKMKGSNYYNAGVLVINTKQFVEADGTNKCANLLLNDNLYKFADQDVLNIFTNNRTTYYDLKWNKAMRDVAIGENLPNIIHYLSAFKPWNFLTSVPCGEIFWGYAEKAEIKEEVIQDSLKQKKFENYFISSLHNINFDLMPRNSKVILYCGNEKAFYYRKQIEVTNYYKLILHCDRDYEKINKSRRYMTQGYTLNAPSDIQNAEDYDYIFIIAVRDIVINSIKRDLEKLGVDMNKVICITD